MDPLFPELPEDLSVLSDEELANLLSEHEVAAEAIKADDDDYIKGMSAEDVLSAFEKGVEQVELIRAEQQARVDAQEQYLARKAELADRLEGKNVDEDRGDEDSEDEEEEVIEVVAEAEEVEAEEEPEVVEEKELVLADASPTTRSARDTLPAVRRPPAPAVERRIKAEATGTPLLAAAGLQEVRAGQMLDKGGLARAMKSEAVRRGAPTKSERGVEERILIARADFEFPSDRVLTGNVDSDMEKIRAVIPAKSGWGDLSGQALVASGGLCAPLTPIYSMPNFAVTSRPVRDALPSFNADRGGVQVAPASYIGDITTAISSISEANDALGGTYATKSCQDLDCPTFSDVAVQILSHCREYGNLNARAWPEKIAHENDLTMAAHARTAEGFLLDRIKALSINVTNGAETLGALIYLVDGIVKAGFGIRGRLRMEMDAPLRVLLPAILPDLLQLDSVQGQFDRFKSEGDLIAYLRSFEIEPSFYLDTPSDGDSQLPDASQAAGALDGLPDHIQWAIFPEGQFIHVDGGALELGLVRDSTLNSTNDFQIFGETFENVAMLGPTQGAYWVTSDLCANGNFPPAGTTRPCD